MYMIDGANAVIALRFQTQCSVSFGKPQAGHGKFSSELVSNGLKPKCLVWASTSSINQTSLVISDTVLNAIKVVKRFMYLRETSINKSIEVLNLDVKPPRIIFNPKSL